MTVIKLQYTLKFFEDGTACLNGMKNNCGETVCAEKIFSIDVPKNCNEILEPIELGWSLQNITSLLIPHCNIPHFPNEFQFCNLIELDLSHNLFKNVPDFVIHRNPNLQKINLSFNEIEDFNLEPKCYKKLQYLYLNNNFIHEIPQWIFNSSCTTLEILNLSNNPFCTFLESQHYLSGHSLIKLCSLEMNNSNIKKYCKFIQEIPNLKNLSISNNCAKDYLNTIQELPFKFFHSVSTLKELNFSRLGYSFLSEEICELSALEVLNISYNHLSWLPDNFSKLNSLQILNLSHNELLSLPPNLNELTNLTELHISYNLIGSLPESLTELNKLKFLDCYSNDLIENSFPIVNKISSLVAFDIEQNSFTPNDDEWYVMLRNELRKDKGERFMGCKLTDVSDDEKSYKSYDDDTFSESETNFEVNTSACNNEEENWDCDNESIDDDSMLVLPRYKFRLIRKPAPYNPSDNIHPMYFEDALDDDT